MRRPEDLSAGPVFGGAVATGGLKMKKRGSSKARTQSGSALPKREIPSAFSFWESLTLEELAELQNVRPIEDIRNLFGTWPGDVDDGFEEDINRLRHPEEYE